MFIVIRSDSSLEIGTGHVRRCLVLANRLNAKGASVAFICRELPGNLCDFIESHGFPVYSLPYTPSEHNIDTGKNDHRQWLTVDWETDSQQTMAALRHLGLVDINWLVVDHYSLDARWEQALRPYVNHIMVIDDLADRPHDCDVLLDQDLVANMETRYNGLIPEECVNLLGPKYALLRPEFHLARQHLPKRNNCIQRILIFFGGVDYNNETMKALKAIRRLNRPEIAVDVVVGNNNPHKDEVEQMCAKLPNVHFHPQVNNMAKLMSRADLAIGAGGTSLLERLFLRLPSILIAVAENQVETLQYINNKGYALYLGRSADISVEDICTKLKSVINGEVKFHYGDFNIDQDSIWDYLQKYNA